MEHATRDGVPGSGSDAPDLSVVIVNYNALPWVRRALVSLDEGAAGLRYESIVVDNASRDGDVGTLLDEFPSLRLIRRAANGGFAVGANAGIRAARAATVLLLNPDARLHRGAAAIMRGYLRAHPDTGIVGPRIENPDGTLQLSCRRFPTAWAGLFNRYSTLTRLLPRNRYSSDYLMTDWDHASTRSVDWVSGAAMMLSRPALEQTGLFDEGYFFAIEDVDLCRRMHAAGLDVVYLPDAVAEHRIGASADTAPARVIVARHRGMWRYYRRHLRGSRLKDAAVATGITARCLAQLARQRAVAAARGRRGQRSAAGSAAPAGAPTPGA